MSRNILTLLFGIAAGERQSAPARLFLRRNNFYFERGYMNFIRSFFVVATILVLSGCTEMQAGSPQAASVDKSTNPAPSSDSLNAAGATHESHCGAAKCAGSCGEEKGCCGGKCDCHSEKSCKDMQHGGCQKCAHGDKHDKGQGCTDAKDCKKDCGAEHKCAGKK